MLKSTTVWISNFILFVLISGSCYSQNIMNNVPIADGLFKPDWKQVGDNYKAPEWFNDAKFGIWIHWGAQSMGDSGDWFAKFMYYPFGDKTNNNAYENHLKRWGHPSVSGYKDVLKDWKADKWKPEEIMKLYKEAGAKYVLILGAHHDNFDNWDSKYQPWNSVNIGPHRDIVKEWSNSAKKEGLRYGISIHSDYSWWWYQAAFASDTTGPYKNVPYDAAQKYNTDTCWWKGYDLKDLYGKKLDNGNQDPRGNFFSYIPEVIEDTVYAKWYCTKWCNRVKDVIDNYQPDLLYFDGNTYPFSGVRTGRGYNSDATIRMVAHFYNMNMKKNHGKLDALMFTKGSLDDRAICRTVESRIPDKVEMKNPFMCENGMGEWFYQPGTYYSSNMAVHQMIEAFALGGNYTLNIPINSSGELDAEGIVMLKEIGKWMKINGEAIYGSHAWTTTKEGTTKPISGNLKKRQDIAYTPQDIRFTINNGNLYAFVMAVPENGTILIQSITPDKKVKAVNMLGSDEKLKWNQTESGLEIKYKKSKPDSKGFVFKIIWK